MIGLDSAIKAIQLKLGPTPEARKKLIRERQSALDERLNKQLESQKMTPEILNKRCTL